MTQARKIDELLAESVALLGKVKANLVKIKAVASQKVRLGVHSNIVWAYRIITGIKISKECIRELESFDSK